MKTLNLSRKMVEISLDENGKIIIEDEMSKKIKEISWGYDVVNGIIQSPGKFEGEPIHTLYFYNCMMNGCGDSFLLESEDYKLFDIPEYFHWVTVYEDNNGFVTTEFSEFEPEDEEEIVEWDDIYIPYMEDEEF